MQESLHLHNFQQVEQQLAQHLVGGRHRVCLNLTFVQLSICVEQCHTGWCDTNLVKALSRVVCSWCALALNACIVEAVVQPTIPAAHIKVWQCRSGHCPTPAVSWLGLCAVGCRPTFPTLVLAVRVPWLYVYTHSYHFVLRWLLLHACIRQDQRVQGWNSGLDARITFQEVVSRLLQILHSRILCEI